LSSGAGRLDGKVALVVGGTSGIGRGIALRYGAEGARVVVASRTRESNEGPEPTDELIRERGGAAEYVELDVTDATPSTVSSPGRSSPTVISTSSHSRPEPSRAGTRASSRRTSSTGSSPSTCAAPFSARVRR
jgi:NAD(P)-dependent dehydrogenase (short-subunit alcohol dehydrogenase family)